MIVGAGIDAAMQGPLRARKSRLGGARILNQ
jgi:hypothetical protein